MVITYNINGTRPLNEIMEQFLKEFQKQMKQKDDQINDLYQQLKGLKAESNSLKTQTICGRDNKEIRNWLKKYEFEQYYNNFIIHGYDKFNVIYQMTEEDLKDIGINLKGHRKQLLLILRNNN